MKIEPEDSLPWNDSSLSQVGVDPPATAVSQATLDSPIIKSETQDADNLNNDASDMSGSRGAKRTQDDIRGNCPKQRKVKNVDCALERSLPLLNLNPIPRGSIIQFRNCLVFASKMINVDGARRNHYMWSLFVLFMKDKWKDPYNPTSENLSTFVMMLEKSGFKNFRGAALNMFKIRTGIQFQETELKQPSFNVDWKYLDRKMKVWTKASSFFRFIDFCCKPKVNQNPFEASEKAVVEFLKKCLSILHRTSVIFPCEPELLTTLDTIKFFQKETKLRDQIIILKRYLRLGRPDDLVLSKDLGKFFESVKSVDLGIDQVMTSLQLTRSVMEITPDCKYLKYIQKGSIADFWREKQVVKVLARSSLKSTVERIDPTTAAFMLGISLEMLMAHKPETNIPLVMKNYFDDGNSEKFWNEPKVQLTINSVRTQEVTVTEGAFQLGVAFADLKNRVGPLVPIKKVKNPSQAKPKLNPLEKLINAEEEDLPEYDVIRLRNIKERLALFNQMGFNSLKQSCSANIAKKSSSTKMLPLREKSRRARNKVKVDLVVTDDKQIPTVPPAVVLLEDVVSMNISPDDGIRFLSALEQEMIWPRIKVKPEYSKLQTDFEVKADCDIFPEQILSATMMPGNSLKVVCVGGSSGSLGVWMMRDEIENEIQNHRRFATNRSCCHFKLHSGQINFVTFNPFSSTKVVTSSDDGFIRSTDLSGAQRSETIFNWYNQGHNRSIFGCNGFITNHEMVITELNHQERFLAFIHDTRSKIVHSPIGSRVEFESLNVALNPVNPLILAGIAQNGIHIYDLRKMSKPCKVKELEYWYQPSYVEYSPDGSRLLAVTHEMQQVSVATIFDLDEDSGPEAICERHLSQNSKFNHFGNRSCVWHPTLSGALVALMVETSELNYGSIVTLKRNGSIIDSTKELSLDLHCGLVSDISRGSILALNAFAKGNLAYIKIEEN